MSFVKDASRPATNFVLTEKQKEALQVLVTNPQYSDFLLIGGSRCVAGDTILDGSGYTMEEAALRGRPVKILTSFGKRKVDSPWCVGTGPMLLVHLDNGKKIEVTPDHPLWTKTGWVEARHLTSDSLIGVWAPSKHPLASNLALTFRACLASVPHLIDKAQVLLGRYYRYRHPHDEQLLLKKAFGPASPVVACSNEQSETHTIYQSGGEQYDIDLDGDNEDLILDEFRHTYTDFTPSQTMYKPSKKLNILDNLISRLLSFSWDTPYHRLYTWAKVISVLPLPPAKYYTLTEPLGQHYMTNGIWSHNSGKTFFGVHLLIVRAIKYPNSRHIICRLRFSHAKTSIWMDTLPKVLKSMGLEAKKDYKLNKTDFVVTFKNGSEVWIDGLDNAERVEKMLGREYNTIYYNEISQIPYDTVTTVQSRLALRSFSPRYGLCRNFSLYDANPPTKRHWSYMLWFLGKDPAEQSKPPLTEERRQRLGYIKMNPMDNLDNVGADYIKLLENLPERKRKRFLDGEYSDIEGQVYTNWDIVPSIPQEVRDMAQCTLGGDFGFTTDPATVIRLYYIKKRYGKDQLWMEQLVYERGWTNQKLAKELRIALALKDRQVAYAAYKHGGGVGTLDDFIAYQASQGNAYPETLMCYMDGHEPKSIVEMQEALNEIDHSILVLAGLLGTDAKRAGIDWLQNVDMFVTQESTDLITELETYERLKDEEGNPTQDTLKKDDHTMDAIRYGVSPYISKNIASVVPLGAS